MKRSFQRLLVIVASVALLGALAGTAAASSQAWVRVVHASPDAPNVDIWVDGSNVLSDVPFTAVSDYLEVPAGDHNVQATATGDTTPVIDADLTLDVGTAYTVAATGIFADIAPVVLVDDLDTTAGNVSMDAQAPADTAMASSGTSPATVIGLLLVVAGLGALALRLRGAEIPAT